MRARPWGCAVLALGLVAPLCLAQPAPQPCVHPLRVGISLLGVAYFKQAGQAHGADLDLARELGRRLHCEVDIVEMSRPRLLASLQDGDYIDLAMSTVPKAEREAYAQFVQLGVIRDYLLVHRRLATPGFDLQHFMAQPGLRMGELVDANYDPTVVAQLAVLEKQGRTEVASREELLIPRLIAGHYDGLILTPTYFVRALRELKGGGDLRTISSAQAKHRPVGLSMSRKTLSDARRQQIASTMEAMHSDGTLLRIYRQYFPVALARERVDFTSPQP